jgi:hypothetical protein
VAFPLILGVRNQHLAAPHSNPLPRHDVGRQTRWRRVQHESRLLGVADPHATRVEINPSVMLHQWEVVVTAA